ncbi:MAG: hypothetical protein WBM71_02450 [Sedimenticolaceae bacterium]
MFWESGHPSTSRWVVVKEMNVAVSARGVEVRNAHEAVSSRVLRQRQFMGVSARSRPMAREES